MKQPSSEMRSELSQINSKKNKKKDIVLSNGLKRSNIVFMPAHQQALIAHLSQKALLISDLDEFLNESTELLAKTFEADCCGISELLPGKQELLLKAGVGFKKEYINKVTIEAGRNSQGGYTLLRKGPVVVKDLSKETRFRPSRLFVEHNVKSGMSVIILGKNGPYGTIGVHSRKKLSFTQGDVLFLQSIANIIGTAIERKKTEQELKQSEELYRSLVETAPDVIFSVSLPKGTFAVLSPSFEKTTGWRTKEWIGKPAMLLVHKNDRQRFKNILEQTGNKDVQNSFTVRVKTKWENYIIGEIHFHFKKSAMFTEKVGVLRDISERTRIENLLERINQASLKFLSPLSISRTYQTIVEEAVKLIGAVYGSILLEKNGDLTRIYASSPLAYKVKIRKHSNTYQTFIEGKARVTHISTMRKVHPELTRLGIVWSVFVPLSYQGKPIGVLTLNTKKKERLTNEELRFLELYGSFASLAIRKTLLFDETKRALEGRDLFISMASHELKTPLTTISGYIQLMSEKSKVNKPVKQDWIHHLSAEVSRLSHLIEDLLTVNRIKSGRLQLLLGEFKLSEVIKRAILDLKFSQPRHRVVFNNHLQPQTDLVIGDFDKLLNVISNIINNAAKFSPDNEKISIVADSTPNHLYVKIKDKGKGINPKDVPFIFKEFYRGREDRNQGMGLGLFLSHHIVTQLHGKIAIKSKPNKGTVVIVQLPRVIYE